MSVHTFVSKCVLHSKREEFRGQLSFCHIGPVVRLGTKCFYGMSQPKSPWALLLYSLKVVSSVPAKVFLTREFRVSNSLFSLFSSHVNLKIEKDVLVASGWSVGFLPGPRWSSFPVKTSAGLKSWSAVQEQLLLSQRTQLSSQNLVVHNHNCNCNCDSGGSDVLFLLVSLDTRHSHGAQIHMHAKHSHTKTIFQNQQCKT